MYTSTASKKEGSLLYTVSLRFNKLNSDFYSIFFKIVPVSKATKLLGA